MRSLIMLLAGLSCGGAAFGIGPSGAGPSGAGALPGGGAEWMKLRRDPARNVTSAAGLCQELIAGRLPELRVLPGEADIRVGWPSSRGAVGMAPTFGPISAGGAAQVALKGQEPTWVGNHVLFDCGKDPGARDITLEVFLSRLSPAVILQTNSEFLDLFVGVPPAELPLFSAAQGRGTIHLRDAIPWEPPEDTRWILFWRGKPTRALGQDDMPLLLVPITKLLEVRTLPGSGLRLRFDQPTAILAAMPLKGILRPPVAGTATWFRNGLPPDIALACNWWANHLAALPVDVIETSSYDPVADRVDVRYAYRFANLRPRLAATDVGTRPMAPLPPMLALALQQGFAGAPRPGAPARGEPSRLATDASLKVSFSAPPFDTGVSTVFGPYVVMDGQPECTWSLSGLNRYVGFARAAGPGNGNSAPFDRKLQAEVEKIIAAGEAPGAGTQPSAAKLPAPWFFQYGLFHPTLLERELYWANPAEGAYYLLECLDLLPPETQKKVLAYLGGFPKLEEVCYVPPSEGTRREGYHIEPSFLAMKMAYEPAPRKIPPLYNLYVADRLTRSLGRKMDAPALASCRRIFDESLRGRDWATMSWFQEPFAPNMPQPAPAGPNGADDFNGVVAANRNFAGLLGWVRLSRTAADSAGESAGMARLASSAALRYAMGRYRQYLYSTGRIVMPPGADWQARAPREWAYGELISFNCARPEEDIQQVCNLDAFGVQTGTYWPIGDWQVAMRPYQVPFLYMVPELAGFLSDHLKAESARYVKVVEEFQPDWYAAWSEATLGTEHSANLPGDAYQVFLARAWVLGEAGEKLRKFVDVPYLPKGDYFYMHKLAQVARAFRAR